MFGSAQADQRAKAIDTAVDKLETFKRKMGRLRSRLQDSSTTSFVVVTIPTKLGVSESKRLIKELGSQGVSVTDVVVNQCVGDFEGKTSLFFLSRLLHSMGVTQLMGDFDQASQLRPWRDTMNAGKRGKGAG